MEIILGAAVSLLVQWLKKYGQNQWHSLGILLVVAILASAGYTFVVATGYWQVLATVLVTAGAFYAFILQRFENPSV